MQKTVTCPRCGIQWKVSNREYVIDKVAYQTKCKSPGEGLDCPAFRMATSKAMAGLR